MDYSKRFKCGLLPDPTDERDFKFSASIEALAPELPSRVSFMERMPPIRNQGQLGACASFAFTHIAAAFDNKSDFSPLFIYYFTRLLENGIENICEDSGSTLRGVLKAANKYGWAPENLWKYIIEKFAVEPDELAKQAANFKNKFFKVIYYKAYTMEEIKAGMAADFIPFVGLTITESFYSEETMKTGLITAPSGKVYGGHGIPFSCYDDNKYNGCFVIDNSWGDDVGDKGRFYLPYDVLPSILTDCWLAKIVPAEGENLEENG